MEGGREGGREGGKEGGREGGREGVSEEGREVEIQHFRTWHSRPIRYLHGWWYPE